MGFRQGAYARIWSVDDMGNYSVANVSVSRKNKETGEYNVEFSDGYVRLVGTAHTAAQELGLPTAEEFDPSVHKGVSIRVSSCDVTNKYDNEKKKLYTNCVIFGFEIPDNNFGNTSGNATSSKSTKKTKGKSVVKTKAKAASVAEEDDSEDELPF